MKIRTMGCLGMAAGLLAGMTAVSSGAQQAASAAQAGAAPAQTADLADRAPGAPDYLDPALPVDRRVDDLISRMTLPEKLSQLNNDAKAIPRLHVPAYDYWSEALHGVARNGIATVFPQSIGMAATFDTPLLNRVGVAVSLEARAKYQLARIAQDGSVGRYQGLTFFSPNINIFRDPRWGRGQETYGEDPYLTAQMAVAFITGMQGQDPDHPRVGATAKHFAVHSGPEPLRHSFDVHPSAHDLEDTYLPAFRAAVQEAHVKSLMCVYNAIDGVPGCASDFLLQKILRQDWKFQGFVVSDCNAVSDIYRGHHYVRSEAAAAAAALKAGVDNECTVAFAQHAGDYDKYADAIKQGLISERDVDQALRRALRVRFQLGMFDPPRPSRTVPSFVIDSPVHRRLALQMAREGMVLLKNDGILPLSVSPGRIAVIGPLADSLRVLEGNYNGTPSHATTVLEGIRRQFPRAQVVFEPGTVTFLRESLPVPTSALSTDEGHPGLLLQYFADAAHAGKPVVSRVEPTVHIGADAGQYFAHWQGWLRAPETGDYRLGIEGGTSQIRLDGKPIVDTRPRAGARGTVPPLPGVAVVHLQKGHRYAIAIDNAPSFDRRADLVWVRRNPDALAKAVAAAKNADVVIAAVGITADLEGEESALDIPGFKGGDRTSLDLPAEERHLLQAVKATGKPLIVVLMSGSGLAVNRLRDSANAILQAWYPGEEGGTAVAETLAGRNDPGGRLPVTFYKSIAQLPAFTDYSMKNRTYRYFTGEPLFPFGYGLSYTTFGYRNLHLSSTQLRAGKPLEVEVEVTNTGNRDGDEVVQLYLTAAHAAGAPLRALCGFRRVHLHARESRKLKFQLSPRDLSHVNEAGERVITAGEYSLSAGGGQPQTQAVTVSAHFAIDGQQRLPE